MKNINMHRIISYLSITGLMISIILHTDSYAQTPESDFKTVDQKTYSFYENGNWDSVIYIGKIALKNNIDYYYLRLRMGIAYYEKTNYRLAALHFEKALKYNSSENLALEYLYYSYIFTNRKLEARVLTAKFSDQLIQKINPENKKVIDHIYFEGGAAKSNNFDKNRIKNKHLIQDTLPIEQGLNGNKIYMHGGLGGYISKNISFYAGISNLKNFKLKQIQTPELYKSGYDTILDNGWYYIDTLYSTNPVLTNNEYTLTQNEFYVNANIAVGNSINSIILTPAFTILLTLKGRRTACYFTFILALIKLSVDIIEM